MKNIQTLKGFRDFLPEDALKRKWLRDCVVSVFEQWGYDPLETPTLEPLELFTGEIGEDEKLFFHFTDQGGRNVALRYDQTVPTSRVVGQNAGSLVFPFKRYQIQSAFRAEKPQKGRYREFTQCDADIFGTTSPLADAEVIALSLDIFRKIGFPKAKVLVSDRALMRGIPYEAIVAIDKLGKIGDVGVIADMVSKGIPEEKAKEYLEFVRSMKPNETLNVVFEYLAKLGFPEDWYSFEPTIARSFSYSDGPIWEVVIPDVPGGSVLGGERYDKLVERLTGQTVPATGFALGFDRTLEAAQYLNLIPVMKTNTKVLVSVFSSDTFDDTLSLASTLRDSGIPTEVYPDRTAKLDKQLKYADRKGIPLVIIQGPDEKNKNAVQIKQMRTRESNEVGVDHLVGNVRTLINIISRNG